MQAINQTSKLYSPQLGTRFGPLHWSTDGTPDEQTFYTLILLGGKFSLRPIQELVRMDQ